MTALNKLELNQLKLAGKYYQSELQKGFSWRIAIFCFAILLISISWLCFTRSLLLIPVIGIMFSAPWLYTIFTEYPQNKKKQ
ncbi:MAG: hypothetical protein AAGA31_14250, partial [Bacteroidota bacterium]